MKRQHLADAAAAATSLLLHIDVAINFSILKHDLVLDIRISLFSSKIGLLVLFYLER